ncbi:MAG TPA: GNAT family N-acetyltransferase [Candidatus Limnocylindrales bacterium]|jgi:GNAT superfamily N-acetyltransferase
MADHTLLIRSTRSGDIPALAEIYLSLARHHAALDPAEYRVPERAAVHARFAAELEAAEEEDLHLVAEVDGVVVGQLDAIGGRRRSPGSMRVPRASASIGIAVLEGWRGQGIGSALMRAAERWARDRGLDVLDLDVATPNEGGRRLYERLGYARVAETMVKPLRAG